MGLGYDFETDREYNFENSIAMRVELGKTCFSPGEYVKGGIILEPKIGNTFQYLQSPNAYLSITEDCLYKYSAQEYDQHSNTKHYVTKSAKEKYFRLNIPLDFSYYHNSELNGQLKLPFSFQIPLNIYPSCYFGVNTYIKHYLTIDFHSINAKKTLIIVIKNPPYFNNYNHLYQSPAIIYREMKKSKLFFSQGSFITNFKLPKNAFSYEEEIPFEIDIDLSQLTMDIRHIIVSLIRIIHKNFQNEHSKSYSKEKSEVACKNIMIDKENRKINIKDKIEIDVDKNPKNIYYKLDNDNNKVSQKFNGIHIYPTCVGGLLSVEYFIKMEIIMDTFWSTKEEFIIPIDLFEPFAEERFMNNNQNNPQQIPYSQINIPKLSPNSQIYPQQTPLPYSKSQIVKPGQNPQVYPQQIPQDFSQQQMNQSQEKENNYPSMDEIPKNEPEDDNPAPPSVMNLNTNDFK